MQIGVGLKWLVVILRGLVRVVRIWTSNLVKFDVRPAKSGHVIDFRQIGGHVHQIRAKPDSQPANVRIGVKAIKFAQSRRQIDGFSQIHDYVHLNRYFVQYFE